MKEKFKRILTSAIQTHRLAKISLSEIKSIFAPNLFFVIDQ